MTLHVSGEPILPPELIIFIYASYITSIIESNNASKPLDSISIEGWLLLFLQPFVDRRGNRDILHGHTC